jgi:hypothetical protein
MVNNENELDLDLLNRIPGVRVTPAEQYSLHIPYYFPEGQAISAELVAAALKDLQQLGFVGVMTTNRSLNRLERDEQGEIFKNYVAVVRAVQPQQPGGHQTISDWVVRNTDRLGQAKQLFVYRQPLWILEFDAQADEGDNVQ